MGGILRFVKWKAEKHYERRELTLKKSTYLRIIFY